MRAKEERWLPPVLHLFELHGHRLAFDAGSGSLLELDETAWRLLRAVLRETGAGEPTLRAPTSGEPAQDREAWAEIESLRKTGVLLAPLRVPARPAPVLKAVCLHVAHSCQMQCSYCFASGGNYGGETQLMSLDTAKAAVDFLLGSSPGVGRWAIDFFGGEPLLNWPVVVGTVHYAETQAERLGGSVHFTLTTNGLALTAERLSFLDEHEVDLVVSIDGRQRVHDALRRTRTGLPTWEQAVNAARRAAATREAQTRVNEEGDRLFPRTRPTLWVRGTFTRHNLDFSHDAACLFALGFPHVSLEPMCGGPPDLALRAEDIPSIHAEYERLAWQCARERNHHFYHFELDPTAGPCVSRRLAACGAGSEYLAVAPAGDLYVCHQLMGEPAFRMGDVWRGITCPEVGERFWKYDVTDSECASCWARFLCGGGCRAAAFFEHGDIGRPPLLECELQKKRWECALWLRCMHMVAREEN